VDQVCHSRGSSSVYALSNWIKQGAADEAGEGLPPPGGDSGAGAGEVPVPKIGTLAWRGVAGAAGRASGTTSFPG